METLRKPEDTAKRLPVRSSTFLALDLADSSKCSIETRKSCPFLDLVNCANFFARGQLKTGDDFGGFVRNAVSEGLYSSLVAPPVSGRRKAPFQRGLDTPGWVTVHPLGIFNRVVPKFEMTGRIFYY